MQEVIKWLNDALAAKEEGGHNMTHYRVKGGCISATNGNITASHPWEFGNDEFLVPGKEFEKVLARMKGVPKVSMNEDKLVLKAGRFQGTVQTLPLTEWDYPGVEDAVWQEVPERLPMLLALLRPFAMDEKDNAPQWGTCVALDGGWCYATNSISIAGAECPGLGSAKALLPSWAVDFILARLEGLEDWAWTPHYVAFRWSSGAWMRSQLVVGQFPEKAAGLVRDSAQVQTTQIINDEFREAMERVGELAEDTVLIYSDRIEARFGKAVIEDGIECEVPASGPCSIFGARFLLPALRVAESWSPGVWPAPCPFRGADISGYVVGRRIAAV